MRVNDDGRTVRAMDAGARRRIIGGSRAKNGSTCSRADGRTGTRPESYWWYVDLRRYAPYAGFGLGLERVQFITGMQHRDVIPFLGLPAAPTFSSGAVETIPG